MATVGKAVLGKRKHAPEAGVSLSELGQHGSLCGRLLLFSLLVLFCVWGGLL